MTRIEQLQQFLLENPQDPFLHYALTMEYAKLGDDEKTLTAFENMVKDYPDYVGTYYHFGKLLEKKGEPERAKEIYLIGIQMCRRLRNIHALSELQGALNLLEGFGDEDEDD